jgi:hypothetical protein
MLRQFVREWPNFKKIVGNRQLVDPVFFGQLWTRYLNNLRNSGLEDVQLPPAVAPPAAPATPAVVPPPPPDPWDVGDAFDALDQGEQGGEGVRRRRAGCCNPKSFYFKKSRIVGRGLRGVPEDDVERFQMLGRYMIHVPSLHDNGVNLKFPSQASVSSLPPFEVSDDLRDTLIDLLHHERLDPSRYSALSKDDKDTLDDLAVRCRVAKGLGIKGSARTQEDIKKFELLRGQLAAGNDAKELILELRDHVMKLTRQGLINRDQAVNVLYQISGLVR